jgi:hypothetical protein
VLLMSTQKSHFAYRLAWENSPLPRIPFIPLHRRDLVSAEEGSRTFVGPNGDRINWRKFEVLGEVLLPIMKSQGQPYPNLNKHEGSRELILDCRMSHDEEVSIFKSPTQMAMASVRTRHADVDLGSLPAEHPGRTNLCRHDGKEEIRLACEMSDPDLDLADGPTVKFFSFENYLYWLRSCNYRQSKRFRHVCMVDERKALASGFEGRETIV